MAPRDMHGTKVASVAWGGVPLAEMANSIGYKIFLTPIRIFKLQAEKKFANGLPVLAPDGTQEVEYTFPIDTSTILNEINFAGDSIVNLSAGRPTEMPEILQVLKKEALTFFVIAAGNSGKPLDRKYVYPARYGGSTNAGAHNLLTVASVDRSGQRAPHSNFGPLYVEIGAIGCLVPSYTYDRGKSAYEVVRSSGTSFAAPQVSFAAALLKAAVPGIRPSGLKMRILAGADIRPALSNDIDDGRVLNMAKTLSVHQDVVEIRSIEAGKEARRLLRGRIVSDQAISSFCSDGPNPSGAKLLKIVPGFDGLPAPAEGKLRLYWGDNDAVLRKGTCTAKDFQLQVQVSGEDELRTYKPGDIVDIVFAWTDQS